MTNNNSVCTRFEPRTNPHSHTHVMLTQDIVFIHSAENCHLWSGSCPHCVEWTCLEIYTHKTKGSWAQIVQCNATPTPGKCPGAIFD